MIYDLMFLIHCFAVANTTPLLQSLSSLLDHCCSLQPGEEAN